MACCIIIFYKKNKFNHLSVFWMFPFQMLRLHSKTLPFAMKIRTLLQQSSNALFFELSVSIFVQITILFG